MSVDITDRPARSRGPREKGIKRRGTAKADTLRGTPYADVLDGRAGADRIFGYAGSDILIGGAGKDSIDAGKGADRIFGNAGSDIVVGGTGKDTIDAGKGNDTIRARDRTRDVILCRPGTDTVIADKADVLTAARRSSGCRPPRMPRFCAGENAMAAASTLGSRVARRGVKFATSTTRSIGIRWNDGFATTRWGDGRA